MLRIQALFVLTALAATCQLQAAESAALRKENQKLVEAVSAITKADYQGNREELRRQAEAMAKIKPQANAKYWEYWRGFAYWRRALNGFNETPPPSDLVEDMDRCAERARAALVLDPKFEDARSQLVGCLAGQLSQVAPDSEKGKAVLAEVMPQFKTLRENGDDNARSHWMVGGAQAFTPYNPDPAKAAATFRKGLAAARKEAALAKGRDPWVPSWGAPEILMSLAYMNANGNAVNKALARAYADGALAMVPDWHYVRDILHPQIDKLEDAKP